MTGIRRRDHWRRLPSKTNIFFDSKTISSQLFHFIPVQGYKKLIRPGSKRLELESQARYISPESKKAPRAQGRTVEKRPADEASVAIGSPVQGRTPFGGPRKVRSVLCPDHSFQNASKTFRLTLLLTCCQDRDYLYITSFTPKSLWTNDVHDCWHDG